MNYGFIDNTSSSDDKKPDEPPIEIKIAECVDEEGETEENAAGKKRKATPSVAKWFEIAPEQNTKVYVSNLPLDITENEFSEVMEKCGMVMKDLKSGKLKLKLYRDSNGELKGDGLCHYIKVSYYFFNLIKLN